MNCGREVGVAAALLGRRCSPEVSGAGNGVVRVRRDEDVQRARTVVRRTLAAAIAEKLGVSAGKVSKTIKEHG